MINYEFILPADDIQHVHILLTDGNFKGVTYKYGKIGLEENKKEDRAHLHFHFDVIQCPESMNVKELEKNRDFKNTIGDILANLIVNAENEGDEVDELGTNNTEEFNTQ